MRKILFVVFMMVFAAGAFAQEAAVSPADQKAEVASVGEAPPVAASPLVMSVTSLADTAPVNTRVEFEVTLRNAGGYAMKVKKLDEEGLECDINGQSWGKIGSSEPVVVLEPGEALHRKFRISGVGTEGPFKLGCSYAMKVNGTRPSAYKVINIIK